MCLLKIVIKLDFGILFSSEFKFKDSINSQIQWWQIINSFVNNLWNLFIGHHTQCHKITQKMAHLNMTHSQVQQENDFIIFECLITGINCENFAVKN